MSERIETPPAPWTLSGSVDGGGDYLFVAERGGGETTATLRARVEAPRGFATVRQAIAADRHRGLRVRFSARLRADAVTGRANLWMRVDAGGTGIAFDNMEHRRVRGTTEWAEHAVVLDVAPRADAVHFGFALEGPGALSVRGLRWEVVDTSVPVTDLFTPRALEPGNLDFFSA